MSKPHKNTPITPEAARRIQSQADRTGTNQAFKARVMSAAAKASHPRSGRGGNKSGTGKGKG